MRQEPRLAEMAQKAIDLLSTTSTPSKGFFLQVEGALIDKRSHANDAAQVLEEIKAFDDAVAVAYEFARRDGNTMVVVTADHECAGFSIIEPGTYTNAEATSLPTNVDSGNPANNGTPLRPVSGAVDPARSAARSTARAATRPTSRPRRSAHRTTPPRSATATSRPACGSPTCPATTPVRTSRCSPPARAAAGFAGSIDNTDIYRNMFAVLDGLSPARPTAPLPAPPASPAARRGRPPAEPVRPAPPSGPRARTVPHLTAAARAALLAGCSAPTGRPPRPSLARAVTLSPQPLPPPAPSRLAGPAPAGTVAVRPGPFDDRFRLDRRGAGRRHADRLARPSPPTSAS